MSERWHQREYGPLSVWADAYGGFIVDAIDAETTHPVRHETAPVLFHAGSLAELQDDGEIDTAAVDELIFGLRETARRLEEERESQVAACEDRKRDIERDAMHRSRVGLAGYFGVPEAGER